MESFTKHTGIVAALNRSNVDTDQIIPKQFLKSIKRTGYGPNAFFDWRYTDDGDLNVDFELHQPRFEGRSILVVRNNFGCGSSREHAVWALFQDGYRVVIAPWKEFNGQREPGFADIFRSNAVKNGLLTVELSSEEVDQIFDLVTANEGLQATVDLISQSITFHTPEPKLFRFEIDESSRDRLIGALDDIALTLQHEEDITRFESKYDAMLPVRSNP
ncbi:MAG: 3-isopropylmalate dehydratase small subunit [Desulfobacterales bacterium]|jgi:3-isopropylmalate/(R)-2-methylmalate dehydratase small subunit